MHLIHVDDDEDCRRRVRDALEGVGAAVTGVASATEALAAMERTSADAVVTDHAPPEPDARSLLARLREHTPAVPVVVYTDEGSESLAGRLTAAGVDAYVPKSDGPDVLADRLRSIVDDGVTDQPPDGDVHPATAERLSLLVEQAPLGIIEWDLDFRAVAWNDAATSLFGYDREEALGRTAWDLVVPGSAEGAVSETWSQILDEDGGNHLVNENVRADGTRLTCEWHNTPLVDDDGDVVGALAFVQDVTGEVRRARQMEALQESTRGMMGADTPRAVAEAVVAAAEEVLDQPVVSVRLHDPERDVLETVAMSDRTRELLDDVVDAPPPVGPGEGSVWGAFESGEAVVQAAVSPGESVYGDELPVESLLFQPLGDHGVLVFGADKPDAFDEVDAYLASILANTAVAAMDSAVRSSELARAETILEAAGDGVFAIDADERYVQTNDRFLEMTGYDRETVIGSGPKLFLSEEALAAARTAVEPLVEGTADVVTYETTVQRADGTALPVEVNQSVLSGDEFAVSVGTVRDISERRRVEVALREREAKTQRLHEVAARLDGCDDPDEICQVVADAARRILNFDLCGVWIVEDDELVARAAVGEGTADWIDARATVDEGISGRTHREQSTVRYADVSDVDQVRQDPGALRSVLSVPLGDLGLLQAVSTDVGAYGEEDAELAELLAAHAADALERVSYESSLRTERDRMSALFDNVPDPVVSVRHTDDGPLVRSVNSAFEETFGYEEAELVDEPIDDFIVPFGHESEARELDRRGRRGELVEREVRRKTADGIREFLLTVVPVDIGSDIPEAFAVYTDVSERKQRRERVEVLNRVLRHDLRNGLNIVRGAAEELLDVVDDEYTGLATDIVAEADDLLSLAGRTRAVERAFDHGDRTVQPRDIVPIVEGIVASIRERYPEADVSVSTPEQAVVRANNLLEIALADLVENAVVHNDRSAPSVEVSISEGDDEMVVLRVADDGPGIPAAEQRLLTGQEEITQLRHGSGLGLWIAHWAVTHGGGELTFTDNDPRGSVVTIRLPLVDAEALTPPVEGE